MPREYGSSPEAQTSELTELTNNWDSILSHVSSHPDNGPLLSKLIRKAKSAYLMDSSWLSRMKDVQLQLEQADEEDEDAIHAILVEALGSTEDDNDEESVEVPEDEEAA